MHWILFPMIGTRSISSAGEPDSLNFCIHDSAGHARFAASDTTRGTSRDLYSIVGGYDTPVFKSNARLSSKTCATSLTTAIGHICPSDRNCIYDEGNTSVSMVKYQSLPILQRVEAYRPIVPPHSWLYACGVA
jgi:hypothetical protein